ncbi:protein SINE3 isoform X1 [Ziziphus jujuba]|uniref:Protein SINE3 isoform X1 n=2 Tax=Ziziphus jujuba TaxID=326968 RepID=A0A6P6G7M5_ZIZJJ|nr:protein SINE3 isoform X1 [Ziziphus jujuba]
MSVSEGSSLDDSKDPVDFSPISEVKMNRQVAENFMVVTDEDLSESSSETMLFSDRSMTDQDLSESSSRMLLLSDRSASSVITIEKEGRSKAADDSKFDSLEAEIVASFLRKAKTQLYNSANMDARSKKLLDTLIEIAVEDVHGVPDKRNRFVHLLGAKTRIVLWCFLLCVLAFSAILLLFSSGDQGSLNGPLPT